MVTVDTTKAQYISTLGGIGTQSILPITLSINAQALSSGSATFSSGQVDVGSVGFSQTQFILSGLETVWRSLLGSNVALLIFNSSNIWQPGMLGTGVPWYSLVVVPVYSGTKVSFNVQFQHGGTSGTINIPAITFKANVYVFTAPF